MSQTVKKLGKSLKTTMERVGETVRTEIHTVEDTVRGAFPSTSVMCNKLDLPLTASYVRF